MIFDYDREGNIVRWQGDGRTGGGDIKGSFEIPAEQTQLIADIQANPERYFYNKLEQLLFKPGLDPKDWLVVYSTRGQLAPRFVLREKLASDKELTDQELQDCVRMLMRRAFKI